MTTRSRYATVAILLATAAGCGDDGDVLGSGGGSGGAGGATSSAVSTGSTAATSVSAAETGAGGAGAGGAGAADPLGLVFTATPDDGEAVPRELTGLAEGATHLEGESFIVHTCLSSECLTLGPALAHLAEADENGDFLIEPVIDADAGPDPAAEVNAYFHLETFLARFRALGFEGLDEPAHIILDVWVDFDGDGEPDDFLAGATDVFGRPGIIMGTIDDRNLAYDPDVFGHEFTHIVTGVSGALSLETALDPTGPSIAAGALREGTADFFAASFADDPEIGEYSAEALGVPYYSSVDNGARCPFSLVGEAHADGQIESATLWDLRAITGPELIEQAFFDVLRELPIRSTLPEVFAALRERLVPALAPGDVEAFDAVLAARGIETCLGVVPLDVGTAAPLWVLGRSEEIWNDAHDDTLSFDEVPSALQFRIDVPDDVTALELDVVPTEDSGFDPDLARIHVRGGEPVEHQHDGDEASVIDDGSALTLLRLDAASSPPLVAGPLFVSITYGGDDGDYALVRARVVETKTP